MGCVYIAEGPNGSYIGKTVKTLHRRKTLHVACAKRGDTQVFYNAMRKYGYEAWRWSELFLSDDDKALCAAEIEAIAAHKDLVQLYNRTDGGQGTAGRPCSPESRAKISAKHAGRTLTAEHRAAIAANSTKGKRLSPETKQRMAEAKKAYWNARREAGLPMRFGVMTEESKAKCAAVANRRWATRRNGYAECDKIGKPPRA